MRPVLLIVLPAFGLASCASTGSGKLPVCDGKHLRTANPYGSVLAQTPEDAAASSAGAAEAKPKALSAVVRLTSFGSCA